MYPRPMNMVPNFSLGSGLSSGVSHMQNSQFAYYPICIFMNIDENLKSNVKIIGEKIDLCDLLINQVIS